MPRTRTYGLDIDTIRFAQRVKQGSGTTILPEPLKQINKFVVGIKKLKLWDSMVCWPMRSIHNAGTGSTVYSLGGLTVSNGTMVNAPSWEQRGLYFRPTSYINAINYPNYPYTYTGEEDGGFGLTIFSVVNPLGWLPNGTSRDLALLGGWTGRPILALTTGVGGGDTMYLQKFCVAYNYTPLGGSYINNYMRIYGAPSVNTTYYKNNFFFAGYSPSSIRETCSFTVDDINRLNGTSSQPVLSYGILPTSPVQLRVGSVNASTNGLISISALINIPISTDTMQLIRNLYKRTLGIGLNLP